MPSRENRVIIACAGSGKTRRLVTESLAERDRRIAIITYTNNNMGEISKRFNQLNSGVPRHVELMTWFTFLLKECARPYQRAKYAERRVESLLFVNTRSAKYDKETDTKRHYFANGNMIYSDKIAKFVVECEAKSTKAVTSRLRQVYTDVFIDEFQDLAGWDLEVIAMLLESGSRVTLVGDPRQHIYRTNPASKNSPYVGIKVVDLVEKWRHRGLCEVESMVGTWRCNQAICDFANGLWEDMDAMTPLRNDTTDHDGVFLVAENAVSDYIQCFRPQVLRWDKRAKAYGSEAVNFRVAKGLQFDRVLIVPTTPIKTYLQTGVLKNLERARERVHVAVTRARHSVAFIFDNQSPVVRNRWTPS